MPEAGKGSQGKPLALTLGQKDWAGVVGRQKRGQDRCTVATQARLFQRRPKGLGDLVRPAESWDA